MAYVTAQKKAQQEVRDERARILKRVEDDKLERKQREAQRREQKTRFTEGSGDDEHPMHSRAAVNPQRASVKTGTQCAIQIRLFDGSTIRRRFPSSDTLQKEVRQWVEEERGEIDTPFTFRQIMAPPPNRTITISEEEESLQSLGLIPSATLILVPIKGSVGAYDNKGLGVISKGVLAGYGLLSSGLGLVSGALGTLKGGALSTTSQSTGQAGKSPSASGAQTSSINIRTLTDQYPPNEAQQLYNGNTVRPFITGTQSKVLTAIVEF